jgi:hypothetical protein
MSDERVTMVTAVTTATQWREAAIVLREHAIKFEAMADLVSTPPLGHGDSWATCGVVSQSGPNGEPLGCGFAFGHDGPHAWASLPTFVGGEAVTND